MLRPLVYFPWRLAVLARHLQKRMTRAETLLWSELKGRKLQGLKFERQRPVDRYVVDFYCSRFALAVEVDAIAQDEDYCVHHARERDVRLRLGGVTVLRFSDDEVVRDLDAVLSRIRHTVRYLPLR